MDEKFEVGGILKAIQASNNIKEEENKHVILEELFSKPPEEIPSECFTTDDVKEYVGEAFVKDEHQEVKERSRLNKKEKQGKRKETKERNARTIFVGNLALDVTRKNLKKIFGQYGEIEAIRIRSIPTSDPKIPKKVALIRKDFHSERNNMNAYVVYKNVESANKAMKCNGVLLQGLHIRVDKCDTKEHDHKKCIFVGNLPFNCTEEKLRQHFESCGTIEDVRVVRDQASGLGKGFGYIKFQGSDGVMFALKLHESLFDGRKLRVQRSSAQQGKRAKEQRRKFGGLRVTSKKDLQMGKKLFADTKSKKSNNAIKRIQNKGKNQKRNKERNLNRKAGKNSKGKR